MDSFIKEYVFEINEFPKYGQFLELHTIRDYFFFDSSVNTYSVRNLIVPASQLLNTDEVPDEETVKQFIKLRKPVMERIVDSAQKCESWRIKLNV